LLGPQAALFFFLGGNNMPRRGYKARPYRRLSDHKLLRVLRAAAARQQNDRCYWCGIQMTHNDSQHPTFCTADHLIPKHNGGRTIHGNIVAACRKCNNGRHPELNRGKRHDKRTITIGDDTSYSPFEVLKNGSGHT
jgi:5-methylcytosine-specific restriction endonuclease McrA